MKKVAPFSTYKEETKKQVKKEPVKKPQNGPQNDVIKGILMKNYIKKDTFESIDDFDKISNQLFIPQKLEAPTLKKEEQKEGFDYKKALKPLAIASLAGVATLATVSFATKKYSAILASKNDFVRPGDLARNINILEEPHFAAYRMLRDPNAKNVAGFLGVGLMSVVTVLGKNFVDGAKEIWVKKQSFDIDRDLQENLIQVETDAFSGKLNVVNTLLSDTTQYFKKVLSNDKTNPTKANFKSFLSFMGKKEEDSEETNSKKDDKKSNIKTILMIGAGVLGFVGLSYALFRNYQKTVKNLDTFTRKFEHSEIQAKMEKAVSDTDKNSAIKQLTDLFKVINAKDETMKTNFGKIKGITQAEIDSAIKEVKSAQIYAQAPEALGGISEKIQYYCYINEERGHLYNWILNPENKFNKYLFLCFSAISATGYVGGQIAEGIKEVVVARENSKNELTMKKQLVDVEINNFKAKKMSAVNPMIDSFMQQVEQGKSKEDLKGMAENILIEIKNGPPYVYS